MTAAALFDLDRRLTRKIESEKGGQFSPTDLEWLVTSGAIDTFRAFVAQQQRDLCDARRARRQSISEANFASTDDQTGPTSKSSGTMLRPDANEALRQARVMTRGGG